MKTGMKRMKLLVAAVGVAAIGATAATPAAAQDTPTPTAVKAYSVVADVNDVNLQGNVPLRPSGRLFTKTASGRVPLAGQFLAFYGARMQPLCAERTDETGYAECDGVVRLTFPLLGLGKYFAVYPGTRLYGPSRDTGQLLTVGSTEILP
jgi:hypothetical protein